MVDQTTDAPAKDTRVGSDLADAGDRLTKEGQALSETLGEARDAVAEKVHDLGDQATSQIGAQAEGLRDEATAGLTAFSDALKAASEQLSGKKLGFAGDVVQQAAGGLENLARSLEGRSPGEMLEGIRSFGRQNPVGFIAGSMLAGFALGRVAAATPSLTGSSSSSSGSTGSSSTGSMSGFGTGSGATPASGSSAGFGSDTGFGTSPDTPPASRASIGQSRHTPVGTDPAPSGGRVK